MVKFQTMKSLGRYRGYKSIPIDPSFIPIKEKPSLPIKSNTDLLKAISMQH
jgi:hypothetical protein